MRYLIAAVLLLNIAQPNKAQVEVTSNILSRVFLVKYGVNQGTGFTIEVQDRQYLITARHLVKGMKNGDNVDILQLGGWKQFAVKPLFPTPEEVDIAVLVLDVQISPAYPLEATSENLSVSQPMYFLGFPFGIGIDSRKINNGYPFPLVKKGICSAIVPSSTNDYMLIILDGMNNPGFSGAPIVFVDQTTRALKVAAVVSGYRNQEYVVKRKITEKGKEDRFTDTDMVIQGNSGIVTGFNIKSAVDIILKNPIGPQVKK